MARLLERAALSRRWQRAESPWRCWQGLGEPLQPGWTQPLEGPVLEGCSCSRWNGSSGTCIVSEGCHWYGQGGGVGREGAQRRVLGR